MASVIIQGRRWELTKKCGSGGFGLVYAAMSGVDKSAIKIVPKDSGSTRELLIGASLRGLPNIIPVLDTDETADAFVLRMPLATKSLRDCLTEQVPLPENEILRIMSHISQGLVSIAKKEIIHRDLKPENVLLLNGAWCLADFGTSRYAFARTKTETRDGVWSDRYASPEQFRGEKLTSATDVYALGVMAYEMASGVLPFGGPDFRGQHLERSPAPLTTVRPRLAALIHECLYKPANQRPAVHQLARRLEDAAKPDPVRQGSLALREANARAADRRMHESTIHFKEQSYAAQRSEHLALAEVQLANISTTLYETVRAAAPMIETAHQGFYRGNYAGSPPISKYDQDRHVADSCLWKLDLSGASLVFSGLAVRTPVTEWLRPQSVQRDLNLPFDVVACGYVGTGYSEVWPIQTHSYTGRVHAIWFCDALVEGHYEWYEVGFRDRRGLWESFGSSSRPAIGGLTMDGCNPVALNADHERLISTFSTSRADRKAARYEVAWPFTSLSLDGLHDFTERWSTWFGEASTGRLRDPGASVRVSSRTWRGNGSKVGRWNPFT